MGPRGWLTLFNTATYARRLEELVRDECANILVVYGDRDEFTGVEQYRSWTEGLQRDGGDRVRVAEVVSGSHFWQGHSGEQLEELMGEWLP